LCRSFLLVSYRLSLLKWPTSLGTSLPEIPVKTVALALIILCFMGVRRGISPIRILYGATLLCMALSIDMVVTRTFDITNQLGIHARVAAKLVETANRFQAEVFLEKDGVEVNGRSILSILTLFCPCGSRLKVRAEGVDAAEAMEAFVRLIEDNSERGTERCDHYRSMGIK